ncbi:DUF1800 domain-containing protein [Spirilliplanes yamanashiensis]|uniref:DUF1800 domain-containing protein n=1 Tax=Spirilliplanes yamanashiensis TaxID=42233 RepID=A0A8J3Y6I9_9ACTN|nr:DUF1800 family protein [Spirilliplanes yamanashiensis]MDP9814780.1 uncharacterized protein (DUF1800 family) [Spirilliplanes yamanashiensis]GIJ02434.1 hypothetical protein Sya03_17860 [Spirilliplanes yamanashiensis]
MTDDVALLLRRAGFGPTAAELTAARQTGYAGTLAGLLDPPGPDVGAGRAPVPDLGPDPYAAEPNPSAARRAAADRQRARQTELISRWWLDRMTVANQQALEKLHFFWHGHWATSIDKVKSPQLMLRQHLTMRTARDIRDMAHRMIVDPALVYWLDGQLNTRAAPNENLGRELLELFLLGIGRYGEADVKQAGRALTGWQLDRRNERLVFRRELHDGGVKTILGATGRFDASSLVTLVLDQPGCPGFIASRMWFRYASSAQPLPAGVRDAMVAAFPSPTAMLRAMLASPAFAATRGTMAKQPVEWLVGAMRQLGLRPSAMPPETFTSVLQHMAGLGQRPFRPPSVGGWTSGAAWLTSAAAQLRLAVAGKLAGLVETRGLTPEQVAGLLCVDGWSDRTLAVLRTASNPRLMLALGLVSPEYVVT